MFEILEMAKNRETDSLDDFIDRLEVNDPSLERISVSDVFYNFRRYENNKVCELLKLLGGKPNFLKSLTLTHVLIGDPGAVFIADFLRSTTTLTSLILNFNDFTCKGVDAILSALSANKTLQELEISNTKDRKGLGYVNMRRLAEHPSLGSLVLWGFVFNKLEALTFAFFLKNNQSMRSASIMPYLINNALTDSERREVEDVFSEASGYLRSRRRPPYTIEANQLMDLRRGIFDARNHLKKLGIQHFNLLKRTLFFFKTLNFSDSDCGFENIEKLYKRTREMIESKTFESILLKLSLYLNAMGSHSEIFGENSFSYIRYYHYSNLLNDGVLQAIRKGIQILDDEHKKKQADSTRNIGWIQEDIHKMLTFENRVKALCEGGSLESVKDAILKLKDRDQFPDFFDVSDLLWQLESAVSEYEKINEKYHHLFFNKSEADYQREFSDRVKDCLMRLEKKRQDQETSLASALEYFESEKNRQHSEKLYAYKEMHAILIVQYYYAKSIPLIVDLCALEEKIMKVFSALTSAIAKVGDYGYVLAYEHGLLNDGRSKSFRLQDLYCSSEIFEAFKGLGSELKRILPVNQAITFKPSEQIIRNLQVLETFYASFGLPAHSDRSPSALADLSDGVLCGEYRVLEEEIPTKLVNWTPLWQKDQLNVVRTAKENRQLTRRASGSRI